MSLPKTIFTVLIATLASIGCKDAGLNNERPSSYVSAQTGDINMRLTWSGYVESIRVTPVVVDFDVRLQEVKVVVGEFVQRGQVLAISDAKELEKNKEKIEENLSQQEAAMAKARDAVARAELDLKKKSDLWSKGLLARKEKEGAERTLQKAILDAEKQNIALEDAKKIASQNADGAAILEIKAPVAGVVSAAHDMSKEPSLKKGASIATIVDPDAKQFVIQVDEQEYQSLLPESPLKLSLDYLGSEAFDVKVLSRSAAGKFDNKLGKMIYEVRVSLPNNQSPPLFAAGVVEQVLAAREDVVVVPRACVKTTEDRYYINPVNIFGIVEDAKEISVGVSNASKIEVTNGMQAGDRCQLAVK